MAEILDTRIPDINTSWENYAGSRVEEFIKGQFNSLIKSQSEGLATKAGYIALLSSDTTTNIASVGIFANEESYAQWRNNPEDNAELLLSSVEIPMGTGGGSTEASYIVKLTNVGDRTITSTKDSDFVAKLRFTSQLYDPSDGSMSDTNEDATLVIETKMQSSSVWRTVGSIDIMSQPSNDLTKFTTVDLHDYIVSGTQSVRFSALGGLSEKKTPYVTISVTKTDINVTFDTKWENPFLYRQGTPNITIPVRVTGNINKTLNLKVTSVGSTSYSKTYEYNLGSTVYTESPFQAQIEHPNQHNLFNIEAWITSGDSIRTDSENLQIMCILSDVSTPLLAINNVGVFQNWSNVKAFDYAIYNPSAQLTNITFTLAKREEGDVLFQETFQDVKNSDRKSLIFDLEVETTDNVNFPASMSFESEGKELRSKLNVVIDNSENYAPTEGADFFLNPKVRNNSESSPNSIINSANGTEIKSTFEGMSFVSDGWVIDEDTSSRCLRVLDGEKVYIDYDAYSDNTGNDGLTIELDFATRNVTNESGHLLDMNTISSVDGLPVGLWVKAQESCFMTTSQRVEGNQNWLYCHDKRTHVAINIVPNLYGQGTNYVRVFVNGVINREFIYNDGDSFWQSVSGVKKTGGILINPSGADIDIYALRIYKKSMSAEEIRQNRLSSFPTVEEKKAFKASNDILGDNGLISYGKCYDKYNTLLYMGDLPYINSKDDTKGDVIIHKPGDPDHSGTLYNMNRKGQGSTSKKYWTWNIQSDFKSEDSKWVDENDVDHGQCYQNADGLPMAKKLVDKRNWASSMQSHKMGATKMYNDLYQEVVGKNEITSIPGKENCRVAVYEDPFMVFQQTTSDAEPVFIGMGTFGSGKADKPTFGYDSNGETKDMLMIEGSDNNPRLTKHQVPWIEGDVIYDENEEGYTYNGITSWDYDMGNQGTISRFIEAFNFIYTRSNRLKYFNGTYTQLKAANNLDRSYCYWVTKAEEGSAIYDMYRYDDISDTWVPGGVTKNDDGTYATLNVKTQMQSYLPSDFASHEQYMEWDKVNDDFIIARRKEFGGDETIQNNPGKIENYFHKKDIMFFMCMMKLLAACDNRAKNTYLWTMSAKSPIRAFQDDLDSIMPIDNQGKLTKPYWVEEHDYDESLFKNYWNGEDNALYNMMEECYPNSLRNTMNEILSAMSKLGGGSLNGCWEKYFFSTQKYFPAVAYNEFARIGYEYAHYQMVNGNYSNDTDPITQSLGSQEECERQWVEDRNMYISSFAEYGEFAETANSGKLIFRSTEQMDVNMDFTTAVWMYPVVLLGQSSVLRGKRAKTGDKMTAVCKTDSNTQITLLGANYMNDIGSWYDKPLNGEFTFAGKRIKTLKIGNDNVNNIHFKATRIYVSALKSLRELDVHNVTTLQGDLDLSSNMRLENLDARNTRLTKVSFPQQEFLKSAKLPSTITDLTLDGQRGLSEFSIASYENIQKLYFNQATCPLVDSMALVENLKVCKNLSEVTILNIDWSDATVDTLTWMLDNKVSLSGKIALADGERMTATLKMRVVGLWGNIDDDNNDLVIQYNKVEISSAKLTGKKYYDAEGNYSLNISTSPTDGNDIIGVTWKMEPEDNEFASIDKNTGVITVNKIGSKESDDQAKVTANVSLSSGKVVETSYTIYFYKYEVQLGDYLFANGDYGSKLSDSEATPVGVVFYVEPVYRRWALAVALSDEGSRVWGLYDSTNANNGMGGIVLKEYVYDVYDVPGIEDFTQGYNVTDSAMLDESATDNDGFMVYPKNTSLGDIGFTEITEKMYEELGEYLDVVDMKAGDAISAGQLKTLRIIKHRDSILRDSAVKLPIPRATASQTEYDNLTDCIKAVQASHNGVQKYQQYYYPAASYSYAYSPKVRAGEELADIVKPNHWFLPSIGETSRLSFYQQHGVAGADKYAIFSNSYEDSIFKQFNSISWYWSSSEHSNNIAYHINIQSGSLRFDFGSKSSNYIVRPVVAFRLK